MSLSSDMETSFPLVLLFSRFQRSHLAQSAQMARGLAELGGQERLHQIPGHFGPYRTSAHAEDIHVIILDALLGGEMIVDETGANAFHLVGAYRRANAAAADRDAAIYIARDDRLGERHDVVGIVVVGIQVAGTEINHFMARRANTGDQ